jgi:hypothetical protein
MESQKIQSQLLGAVRDAFPGKPVEILWNLTRAYIYTLSYNDQKSIKWKKVKILGAFLIGARDKGQRAETLAERPFISP